MLQKKADTQNVLPVHKRYRRTLSKPQKFNFLQKIGGAFEKHKKLPLHFLGLDL
jgi:hypothetical protein